MKWTAIALAVVTSTVAQCSAAAHTSCGTDSASLVGIQRVLDAPPADATSEFVAQTWPTALPWGSRDGTLSTLSHLAYVIDDECLCCDSFTFEDVGGTDLLVTINLSRFEKSITNAHALARELHSAVAARPEEQKLPFTSTRNRGASIVETSRTTVERVRGGWIVRLLVSRINIASADTRGEP